MPPPDPEHDAALIERSWHDPEAFAGLYDRHAAPLHRYAARRLGPGAADDIVADTFLDAFRKRRRYDRTVTDARPWLYGIAANLIGKHSRSEVRMLRAYARTGADPVLAETQTDFEPDIVHLVLRRVICDTRPPADLRRSSAQIAACARIRPERRGV